MTGYEVLAELLVRIVRRQEDEARRDAEAERKRSIPTPVPSDKDSTP